MINIPDVVRTKYYQNSVPKRLVIPVVTESAWDVSNVNWYTGQVNYGSQAHLDSAGDVILYCNYDETTSTWDTNLENYVYKKYLNKASYVYISALFSINSYTTLPTQMYLAAHYTIGDTGYGGTAYAFNPNNYLARLEDGGMRIYTRIDASLIDEDFHFTELVLWCSNGGIDVDYGLGSIQIENSNTLYEASDFYNSAGTTPLPYLGESIIRHGYNPLDYITVGQDNIDDVSNENLVGNGFTLTESLCSQDNLKFGVCEASHVTFEMADRNEKFKDRVIKPYIEIPKYFYNINWYKGSLYHTNPETGASYTRTNQDTFCHIDKAFCESDFTNYLDYFDTPYLGIGFDFTLNNFELLEGTVPSYVQVRIAFVRRKNGVDTVYESYNTLAWTPIELDRFKRVVYHIKYSNDNGEIVKVLPVTAAYPIRFMFLDDTKTVIPQGEILYNISFDITNFQIEQLNTSNQEMTPFNIDNCYYYNGTLDDVLTTKIPLGVYTIKDLTKKYIQDISKTSITAYDDLVKLEQNAYDWYTLQMYAVSMTQYNYFGAQFARQIFSTYRNIITQLGLDSRQNHTEDTVISKTADQMTMAPSDFYILAEHPIEAIYRKVQYCYIDIDVSEYSNKLFVVEVEHLYPSSLESLYAYSESIDPYFRGLHNIAEVLVVQDKGQGFFGLADKGFCVNNGDYFKLDDDCQAMRIYIPRRVVDPTQSTPTRIFNLLEYITVKHSDYSFDLANATTRLLYYQYIRGGGEIFPVDSSITARDVVRSLLEVCGCFFRLNRLTGLPEFIYPTKGGLYPAEDLYPSNDLYPRQGYNQLLSMGKYITFDYEDYEVHDIGRIQIIKNTNSNEAKSICEWEYIGDIEATNTYLIDDNIFYCNEHMEYDYDAMSDVSEMLEGMYSRISHLAYVPHRTEAIGLPFIECGDRLGLITKKGGLESFIWHRTLKGIQALRDTYEAEGDEYTQAVNDYGYKIWEG